MVVAPQGQYIGVDDDQFLEVASQISIRTKAQRVDSGEEIGPVLAFLATRVWHVEEFDFQHLVEHDFERLAHFGAYAIGNQAHKCCARLLSPQAVTQGERTGDVVVVEHDKGHVRD